MSRANTAVARVFVEPARKPVTLRVVAQQQQQHGSASVNQQEVLERKDPSCRYYQMMSMQQQM